MQYIDILFLNWKVKENNLFTREFESDSVLFISQMIIKKIRRFSSIKISNISDLSHPGLNQNFIQLVEMYELSMNIDNKYR